MPLKDFLQRPKLVIVLVIDQFRSDYMIRYHQRFVQPGQNGQTGGFLFLMNQGAYFPFAEYDVLQNMTCSGHAMIMTGSTPDLMGVSMNEWYDRKTRKMVSCTNDDKDKDSPRNLKTSTVGDELKSAGVAAKIIGISLKDRSAVMLGGHRADLALWFDKKSGQWTSSPYYQKELPTWALSLNQNLKKDKGQNYIWKSAKFEKKAEKTTKSSLATPYGTELLFKAATEALQAEKLGQNSGTDMLVLSLSNHDFAGHIYGPNAPEMEELTVVEDLEISKFLTSVKKQMKDFKEVVVVLTADHGVPPLAEDMVAAKMDAGRIDCDELSEKINQALSKKFGAPKSKKWIAETKHFHFWFNQDALIEKKLSLEKAEEVARTILLNTTGVKTVFTRTDSLKNKWPIGIIGEQLKRQYRTDQSGDLLLIPQPFYMEKDDNNVTHITGYSYDKQVPLIFMGAKIKPGVYTKPAKVLDLAPTLSFILGITAPATNQGQVLQIFE